MLRMVDSSDPKFWFSDPKFWTDGLKVVTDAPQIVIPLLVAVAIGVWWLARSQFRARYEGAINGLKEQVGGLKTQIGALEERLRLAQDSEQTIARKSTDLESQVATLTAQIAAGEPKDILIGTTRTISSTASDIKIANTESGAILTYQHGGDSESLGRKTRP